MKYYFKIYQSGAASYVEFPFDNDFSILSYGYKFSSNDYNACTIVINSYDQQLKNSKNQIESLLNERLQQTPFSSLVVNSVFGAVSALTINDYSVFFGLVECEVTPKESSSAPDYTDILTSINANLSNLNNKFVYNNYTISDIIRKLFMSVVANCSLESLDINLQRNSVGTTLQKILSAITGGYQAGASIADSNVYSYIKQTSQNLKQSVSPNANITDVISSLNTNIHNDLTNINTTTENKDTILLIDGQQEFKLRNKEEIDF